MTNLTKLREIAEAATPTPTPTPGPWQAGMTTSGDPNDGPTHACVRVEGAHWTDHLAVAEGCAEADLNMAHIATFDPPTALELIDEIERLRKWKCEAKQVFRGLGDLVEVADVPLGHSIIKGAIDCIEELRKEIDSLQSTKEEA